MTGALSMWRIPFWRITFALGSILILTATFAASVLADSHEAAGGGNQGGGRGGGRGGGQEAVTAAPSVGVGTMSDQVADALLLGLIAVAAAMAVLAVVTARRARV